MYRDETKNLFGKYQFRVTLQEQISGSLTYLTSSIDYIDFLNEGHLYKFVSIEDSNARLVGVLSYYITHTDVNYWDFYYSSLRYSGSTPEFYMFNFNFGNKFSIIKYNPDGSFDTPKYGLDGSNRITLFD